MVSIQLKLCFLVTLLTLGVLAGEDMTCMVRSQALNAASKLLPGCRRGDVSSCQTQRAAVYTGLSLKTLCNVGTLPVNAVPLGNEAPTPVPSGVDYYVSTTGSDSNNGLNLGNAFLTIEKALAVIGALPTATKKVLHVSPGTYSVTSSLTLTQSHSNLVIVGDVADRPRISASIVLPRNTNPWVNVGKGIVKCTLDSAILSQLGPLSMLFVGGEAAIRARAPNVDSPLDQLFDARKASRWGKGKPFPLSKRISRVIIPADNPDVQYAGGGSPKYDRYTAGYVDTARVANPPFDPAVSYFLDPTHVAQGGCPYTLPTSATWKKKVFSTKWAKPTSALFHTLHWYGWGAMTFQVKSQSAKNIVFGNGGWQEARGDCKKGGLDWFVENVLELLDAKNEYFLDLEAGELYYMPPNSASNPVLNSGLVVELTSSVRNLMKVSGASAAQPAKNITIQGIEFFGAYDTIMDIFEVPSGGDFSLHRSGALLLEQVENILVEDSLFRWCGGNALMISKHASNIRVIRNEFYALGASAIMVVGNPGYETADPWVIKEFPSEVEIKGNLASFIGLHLKQVSGVFVALSKTVNVIGNVFFWGPRAGITINDQFSGGRQIKQNLIFEMVRGTADMGPIILWNRQMFEDPVPQQFDVIEENFFIGTPGYGKDGGGKGINVDDGAHKVLSNKNVVVAGYHKLKGSFIHAYNNLIIQPIQTTCVYFSHLNRIPASLEFSDNTCITSLPAYAFGVVNSLTFLVCQDKNNFNAHSNKFYTSTKTDKLDACASSWNTWTTKWKMDQDSLYTRNMPSSAQVTQLMKNTLSWLP